VQVTNGNINSCYMALETFMDSKKTVIYFDNGDDLNNAYHHLLSRIRTSQPSILQATQIAKFYADLAPETKQLYMSKF
ncbi:hypothetical protein BGZ74_005025, partial [Mortierella antarctica]